MNRSILTASHYGVVRFGDLECEAAFAGGALQLGLLVDEFEEGA